MSLAPILYNEDPEAAFLRPGKNSLFLWPKRITARVGPDSYTAISSAHNTLHIIDAVERRNHRSRRHN